VSFFICRGFLYGRVTGIGGEHLLKERRRLSDYLLLHKVFIANRFYKRYDGG